MKINLTDKKLVETKEFVSTLTDFIAKRESVLKERSAMHKLAMTATTELHEKRGTFNVADDKEVLAHLIRTERAKIAGERHDWTERIAAREDHIFDEIYDEALSKLSGLMYDLTTATAAQIAEKLKTSVGEEEANRLANLSGPVAGLQKLIDSRFVNHHEPDFKFNALRKMLTVFEHILGDDHTYESLMKRLANVAKRAKA